MAEAVVCICKKLAMALGKVFLKISRASSSLRILMVSAKATISCARIFFSSSWTAALDAQFFSKSFKKALSSNKASEESPRSFFIDAISTPSRPTRSSFSSMAFDNAPTSFFLAFMRSSYVLTAASSVAIMSFWSAYISSFIDFKMPTISPLCGAYSLPCSLERKDNTSWWSSSKSAWLFDKKARKRLAALDCKKLAAMPCSRAPMPLTIAL
mmetsp:Transcript_76938/g.193507  ORF Transcript_76938/g.193507 Transcript_76938/m.193507 type:complete len:212 (-) Transcript_76938:481-1116(-)